MPENRFWEIRQSEEPSRLELYIYSDIEGDSYDFWTGETVKSETSAEYFKETLAKYPDAENIDIYINSCGGSVYEGTAIYNLLKRHSAYKTAYIDGFAYSIASVVAMAADKVVMPKNTLMLIHNVWTYACGNSAELRKTADQLDVYNEASRQAYLAKAGEKLAEDRLIEMMDSETLLTAEQCVELGLADEYADYDADMSEAAKTLEQAKQRGMTQYCRRLTAASARKPDTRNTENASGAKDAKDTDNKQTSGDFEEKAIGLFEKFLNLKGEN